jgi:drug/metabolite transporter (DMT)-like permease
MTDGARHRLKIAIGFAVISTVWGSTWIAIKIGLETLPPFLAAGIRFVVASLVLLLIIRLRHLEIPFTSEARKTYYAIGVLSFCFPFALVYWGEQFIPSSLGSILFASFPFTVAVFFHCFANEKMDRFKVLGTVLGFSGVVVVFAPGISWIGGMGTVGMLTVMIAVILQAYALIPIKKYGKGVSPFVMNFVGMSMCAVFLLGLSAVFERGAAVDLNARAVGSILYLAVFGSVVAFVTYYWLLKHLDAVFLSLSSFINPIVAVVLGAVVLGETLPPTVLAGASIVLAGMLTTNGRILYARIRARA